MSATANREIATETGRLVDDPRAFKSKAGKNIVTFRLAVEKPIVPGDWRGEKETTFYNVVTFEPTSNNVLASLKKGDRAIATGREEDEEWTGKDGTPHTGKKIVAETVGADLKFEAVQIARTRR